MSTIITGVCLFVFANDVHEMDSTNTCIKNTRNAHHKKNLSIWEAVEEKMTVMKINGSDTLLWSLHNKNIGKNIMRRSGSRYWRFWFYFHFSRTLRSFIYLPTVPVYIYFFIIFYFWHYLFTSYWYFLRLSILNFR